MHELDRALGEFETGMDEFESGDFEFEASDQGEWQPESDSESVFDEVEEMELAASLLEISDEQELDQFLGSLIKKAGKAVGGFVRSPIGKALGGVLKKVAGKVLPIAGTALGNLVVPGLGGMVGGRLASAAGSMFGLELEGMSPQDQELEVARRFVRLAGGAVQQAAQSPQGANPVAAAKDAVLAAAQQHAPGLLSGAGASTGLSSNGNGNGGRRYAGGSAGTSGAMGRRKTGRWVRRGNRIVLLGI